MKSLIDLAEDLNCIAAKLRQIYAIGEFGHDDRVLLRDVHHGVTKFAQQLDDLSRRTP